MQRHHLEPLSIFLIKRGGSGDRILFRYPYSEPKILRPEKVDRANNPYSLGGLEELIPEDSAHIRHRSSNIERLNEKNIIVFPNDVLSNLFAVKQQLCNGEKFELKIDDVRFVGHPVNLEMKPEVARNYYRYRHGNPTTNSLTMFHVVFALSTRATFSVAKCYHDLSKQLAIAIRYEERRAGYLNDQAKIMLNLQDEADKHSDNDKPISPFALALEASQLARDLKKAFEDVSHTGYVEVRINDWSEVLFCLPQKVHKKINPSLLVEPESIFECMKHLRPYHALLLLQDAQELIAELPLDYNTAVKKVIQQASPLKNFRVLAADTDISKSFVFQIGMHLLYWGKATVIYPLCNTNLYVVSPNVPNPLSPVLTEKFAETFPGLSLAEHLQMFSLPISVTQALPSVSRKDEYLQLARVIVWCLQHHLLIQLHTYITLAITDECDTHLPDPFSQESRCLFNLDNGANSDDKSGRVQSITQRLKTIKNHGLNIGHHSYAALLQTKSRDELLSIFSEAEQNVLRSIPATENIEDLRLFIRIAPYFSGRYHLEEIMYHENVRRSHLLQLLDKFRSVVIRHEHEDTNVTMYFNSSITSS